jgi:hypothetical protein
MKVKSNSNELDLAKAAWYVLWCMFVVKMSRSGSYFGER